MNGVAILLYIIKRGGAELMSANEVSNQVTKEELLEKDRKYVWHHMSAHNENPMILASGEGKLGDGLDGNRYLDGMSGLWCVNVGSW